VPTLDLGRVWEESRAVYSRFVHAAKSVAIRAKHSADLNFRNIRRGLFGFRRIFLAIRCFVRTIFSIIFLPILDTSQSQDFSVNIRGRTDLKSLAGGWPLTFPVRGQFETGTDRLCHGIWNLLASTSKLPSDFDYARTKNESE
jgi:hypothetical protein